MDPLYHTPNYQQRSSLQGNWYVEWRNVNTFKALQCLYNDRDFSNQDKPLTRLLKKKYGIRIRLTADTDKLPTTCTGAASAKSCIRKTNMAAATKASYLWRGEETELCCSDMIEFHIVGSWDGRKHRNADLFKSAENRLLLPSLLKMRWTKHICNVMLAFNGPNVTNINVYHICHTPNSIKTEIRLITVILKRTQMQSPQIRLYRTSP